jgi:hypothetical protein
MRFVLALLLLALFQVPPAHVAGGAYVVDDSEIGAAGECKIETRTATAEVIGHDRGCPGMQLGLRPTILDGRVDLDFILGNNPAAAWSRWLTLGETARL